MKGGTMKVESVRVIRNQFTEEKIKPPDTIINADRNVYVELLPKHLTAQNRKVVEGTTVYSQIRTQQDVEAVGREIAIMKYGSENCYLHDLGCGIHTALTKPGNTFANAEITKSAIIVDMSIENVKKLMFGHIVNKNGHAIRGAGRIVKDTWYSFSKYFNNEVPFPMADTSIQKDGLQFIARGFPVRVNRVYLINDRPIGFQIQLDRLFYPLLKNDKGEWIVNDHFLFQILGTTAFLQFSENLVYDNDKEKDTLITPKPSVKVIRRLINTYQAAFNCSRFPFVYAPITRTQKGNNNRIEISLNKSIIQELYPHAVSGDGRIDYKTFIQYCNTVGKIYKAGIDYFGLKLNDKILVPVQDRAARFTEQKVFIICEKGTPHA